MCHGLSHAKSVQADLFEASASSSAATEQGHKKLRGSDLSDNCPEPRNLPCDCCIIETCEEVSLPHCTTVDSVVPLCSRMRALVEMSAGRCEPPATAGNAGLDFCMPACVSLKTEVSRKDLIVQHIAPGFFRTFSWCPCILAHLSQDYQSLLEPATRRVQANVKSVQLVFLGEHARYFQGCHIVDGIDKLSTVWRCRVPRKSMAIRARLPAYPAETTTLIPPCPSGFASDNPVPEPRARQRERERERKKIVDVNRDVPPAFQSQCLEQSKPVPPRGS